MKNFKNLFLAAGLAVGTAVTFASLPASAHEADCPYCSMPITQDTAKQDNEVVLKFGRKRIEYKCVYCAIAEAKSEFANGDVTIAAPSEKKGHPVVIKRVAGKWSTTAATAYFVTNAPLKHKLCDVQARAFHSKAAAQTYLARNKDTFGNAKVLSLTQFVAVAK